MATEIATAYVGLQMSARGIKKQVEDVVGKPLGEVGDTAGKKAGDSFAKRFEEKVGTSLSTFGKKAAVGAAAFGLAMFDVTGAAGNLQAAIAASSQVLGDASGIVQDWADDSVEAVGLSEAATLSAATSFGQLGKIAGESGQGLADFSIDLVGLAADMAAFADVPAAQALEDLQSGFAGQSEVLRKYGIFIDEASLKTALYNETGEKVSGTLTAQQRIIAVNSELWRQTGDIQGQAARESDGWQRQLDNLKATWENASASIGATILPAVSGFVGFLSDRLVDVQNFNEETGGMLGAGLVAGAGALAAASGVAILVDKASKAVDWFKGPNGVMGATQKAALGFGALALVVTAGFMVWQALGAKQREIDTRTREVAGALDQATSKAWEYAEASAGASGSIDGFSVAQQALSAALTDTGEDGEKIEKSLGAIGLQARDAAEYILAFGADASDGSATAEQALFDLAMASGEVNENQARNLAGFVNSTDNVRDAIHGQSDAMAFLIQDHQTLVDAMEEVQDQAQKIETDTVAEEYLVKAAATSEYADELIREAEHQADASRVGEGALDVYFALQTRLGEMSATERDAAQAALGFAESQTEATSSMAAQEEVAGSTIDTMSSAAEEFDAAARKVDDFKSALDDLIDPHLSLQEATDERIAGLQEVDEYIAKAKEGEEGYALTLTAGTEAGRENRQMIRDRVDDIQTEIDAMLDQGASVTEVTGFYDRQRDALVDQLVQFGLTERGAEDYVNALGLTPDAVRTVVDLIGEQEARTALDDFVKGVTGIPQNWVTRIEFEIDQGNYQYAMSLIRNLTASRSSLIGVGTRSRTKSGVEFEAAHGDYSSTAKIVKYGEDGDEWIAPLTKPDDMERWLEDSRIRQPVMKALGAHQVDSGGNGNSGPSLQTGDITVADPRLIPKVVDAFDELLWKMGAR